jgi:hypothetical protein
MIAVVLSVYVAGCPESFSAAMIFTALSLLNQIRFPLLFYPNAPWTLQIADVLRSVKKNRLISKNDAVYSNSPPFQNWILLFETF